MSRDDIGISDRMSITLMFARSYGAENVKNSMSEILSERQVEELESITNEEIKKAKGHLYRVIGNQEERLVGLCFRCEVEKVEATNKNKTPDYIVKSELPIMVEVRTFAEYRSFTKYNKGRYTTKFNAHRCLHEAIDHLFDKKVGGGVVKVAAAIFSNSFSIIDRMDVDSWGKAISDTSNWNDNRIDALLIIVKGLDDCNRQRHKCFFFHKGDVDGWDCILREGVEIQVIPPLS